MTARRILLTGATGVVGSELVPRLRRMTSDDTEIVVLTRSGHSTGVRTLACDLADPMSVAAAGRGLGRAGHTIAVHCAADVSWHRSRERLWPLNVEGTRSLAALVRATSHEARLVYVSSAYTSREVTSYRNAYEETKAAAEGILHDEFADLEPVTFSCSLVVGDAATGAIARFHGLYPLFHILERFAPPFLVGERDVRVDLVPVDWVADELAHLVGQVIRGAGRDDVVASAGSAAPTFPVLVGLAVDALNRARQDGRDQIGEIPVLRPRQWRFLRRTIDAWEVGDQVERAPLAVMERLLRRYQPYLEDGRVRPPTNVTAPAPPIDSYLDAVVTYWLAQQRRHDLADASP